MAMTLSGTAGADSFAGLDGNDTYIVTAGDSITGRPMAALDTRQSDAPITPCPRTWKT
jgi:hypothetical protein